VNAANTSGTKRVAGKKAAAGKVRRAPLGFILKPSRPRPRSRPRGARGGARDARSTRARDARDRRARAIDRPRGRARDAAIGERTATRRSIDRATSGGGRCWVANGRSRDWGEGRDRGGDEGERERATDG
jgi:hypothetical protein